MFIPHFSIWLVMTASSLVHKASVELFNFTFIFWGVHNKTLNNGFNNRSSFSQLLKWSGSLEHRWNRLGYCKLNFVIPRVWTLQSKVLLKHKNSGPGLDDHNINCTWGDQTLTKAANRLSGPWGPQVWSGSFITCNNFPKEDKPALQVVCGG